MFPSWNHYKRRRRLVFQYFQPVASSQGIGDLLFGEILMEKGLARRTWFLQLWMPDFLPFIKSLFFLAEPAPRNFLPKSASLFGLLLATIFGKQKLCYWFFDFSSKETLFPYHPSLTFYRLIEKLIPSCLRGDTCESVGPNLVWTIVGETQESKRESND